MAEAPRRPDLILDLGANRGEDTEFYLAKGFKVVAVEANPLLFQALRDRMAEPIAAGQLVLYNIGIWTEAREATFYLNEDNDHWSSFDPAYGTREGTRYRTLPIRCVPIQELLLRHGVPHYLKIDIEGADRLVLGQLRGEKLLPRYISVEEYGVQAFRDLHALGYRWFKAVPQLDKRWAAPPNPPREGRFVERQFGGQDSGLFGAELPDAWVALDPAIAWFSEFVRAASGEYVGPAGEWWDIHATL
jgi:FkbM family methyltransferase